MIGNKIKALLNLKNKTTNDVCESLQIIDTAYYRKIKKNTFKAEELIILARYLPMLNYATLIKKPVKYLFHSIL